jgi:D-alanyl-D-alanine carboxypeptidase
MPFTDVQYEPLDLLPLISTKTLHVQGDRTLRKEAGEQLIQLSEAFYQDFQEPLVVVSAYRSYQYQKSQISESCKQSGYCSREGESEHQLGLAVDIREASNEEKFLSNHQEYYDWLRDNAHNYGFHQSYQKGKEIDGYPVEPWHWRYVGVELATELWENGMTLSEKILGKRL